MNDSFRGINCIYLIDRQKLWISLFATRISVYVTNPFVEPYRWYGDS